MTYKNQPFEIMMGGHRYFLCILSETSFRFYREDAANRSLIEEPILLDFEVSLVKKEHSVLLEYGKLLINVEDEGVLQIWLDGHVIFGAALDENLTQNRDYGLASLEGHAEAMNGDYRGGMRILSSHPVYGLGERTGPLDKRGYEYVNWNTDIPDAHTDVVQSLYQSIPFFILYDKERSIGCFFDNTTKSRLSINKQEEDAVVYECEDGAINLYCFFGDLPGVIKQYNAITGRNPLPPYWALGAQQSRWSYANKAQVEAVIQGYEEAGIPLSAVYLDIDYMDHYKDFTVDENKFPDISNWLSALSEKGIRVVPIIDAGVKAEEGYFLYDEGVSQGLFSTLNGEIYHNEVWPGDSVFPAFVNPKTRQWWALHIRDFLGLGFSGIWNDMNEPASFKGPLPLEVDMGGLSHREAHNVYGHLMCEAGAEGFALAGKRVFQLTRAGYAGTCRYSGTWAGDNQSLYDHLRLSFPQLMNMSLSGQGYIGVDIGGFGGDCTPELLAKWAIASIFNPLYRNHSAYGTKDQEPYHLNGVYLESYRKAVLLRYELLPYLYDELYRHEKDGACVLRPLVYNYPDDERTYNENTEMMLGDALLIAPSFFPGETKRSVYFPSDFYDIITGKLYKKGDHIIDVSLPNLPVFVAKEALFAISSCQKATRDDTLLILSGGHKATYYHYEDAGDGLGYRKGEYNLFKIEFDPAAGALISYVHHGLPSRYRKAMVRRLDEGGITPIAFDFE